MKEHVLELLVTQFVMIIIGQLLTCGCIVHTVEICTIMEKHLLPCLGSRRVTPSLVFWIWMQRRWLLERMAW